MHDDLRKLVAEDGKVRIVYRDLPILGDRSIRAARLAIASGARGSHTRFNDELMRRGGSLDEVSLHAAATRAGIKWRQLELDLAKQSASIDALIADTRLKAEAMGLTGTPILVVGPFLAIGRQSPEQLRTVVRQAREAA